MAIDPATSAGSSDADAFEATAREEQKEGVVGAGPWRIAMRRLRRDRVSLAFGALFLLIVAI
ncbi:MAG: hypothetical protein QOK31_252, partial [Solirubrobacteraceae bacterium]|nr:hypothetical protein [Solirubrobacteraceae bacterium]